MNKMKVLGLIVEYNPFHNGHLHHLQQSKLLAGAECTICVMSGNFIQRGEPAIINKWARAEAALMSGVDLVIELPMVYAMASAEFFAYGAVKILDSIGVVDYLCFGSESGNMEHLNALAQVLYDEPESYKALLKEHLDKGFSYPAAREGALRRYLGSSSSADNSVEETLNASNNILGVEYLKALKRLKSNIVPLTIPRIGNAYNSQSFSGSISSATSIRKRIYDYESTSADLCLDEAMPACSLSLMKNELKHGRGPVFPKAFEGMILSEIRKMPKEQLKEYPYITEGLENRIKSAADSSGTLDELIDKTSTRRYARTRIKRSLFCILNGVTAADMDTFRENGGPQYARILGFNKRGRELLPEINKKSTLPLIVKTADFKYSGNPVLRRMLELEAQSTDIYVLGYRNSEYRTGGQEFTQNIIMGNRQ